MKDSELASWRRDERARLLQLRASTTQEQRRAWSHSITNSLLQGFPMLPDMVASLYWPFKGEFDPRVAIRHWRAQGGRAALPVVLHKQAPMQFRQWWPGVATQAGVFGLPNPQNSPVLIPDLALIPPIGFDAMGYRLGYGGGYFDRTLAALSPQPIKIGVAFESARIATIHPHTHDIAMDFIVTQAGIHQVCADGLVRIEHPEQTRNRVESLLRARGLPRAVPP